MWPFWPLFDFFDIYFFHPLLFHSHSIRIQLDNSSSPFIRVSLYFVTLSAKPVHLSATNSSKFKPKYLPPPFSCCFSYLPKFYSTHRSLKVSPNLIHHRSKISQNEEEKSLNPLVHLDKVTAASIRE